MIYSRILFVLIIAGFLTCLASQQQYFKHKPRNTTVLEGGEVIMECEIGNLAGKVQWAKEGFALGYSPVIQGFPRYSVVGERRQGIYNLKITNVSLEDGSEYQCQVGPAKGHDIIRANAFLEVISPPASVEIIGHPSNSKIEIHENQEVKLECKASKSKPPATLVWYRGREELKIDHKDEEVIELDSDVKEGRVKRYTVRSSISLKPTSKDDYVDITCEARHEALPRDMPMRTTVQLSVFYPPGAPYIEGYANGEKLRKGQNVELVCRSRGGNPLAQLVWYKNNDQIQMTYRTAGRLSENIYTFVANASDNKARYKCTATNTMIATPLETYVDLTVYFAPAYVTITGPSEARVNDTVTLTCTTAASNPSAEIRWIVNGKQMRNVSPPKITVSPEGGEITTSNISIVVEANRKSLSVVCQGINNYLTDSSSRSHTINILYPPSEPIITGYVQGSILRSGTVQKVMCISNGGNPLATLTWFKNDVKIDSVTKTAEKQVTSELTILANVTDNNAQYRCEASNSATNIPLFETITLAVHFPPQTVSISVEPKELKPGMQAILTCDASASNPAAVLSWYRDGIPAEGYDAVSKAGLYGGTVSSIRLKVNTSRDMNGVKYTCQAMNEALQRSVHNTHIMKILYPPMFDSSTPEKVNGTENETLIITVKATGNPSSIIYDWTKDGLSIPQVSQGTSSDRIFSTGPVLNISNISRLDAGIYKCRAKNSEGSITVNIDVDVLYGASIVGVSKNVLVNPGEEAKIFCNVTGNPIEENNISWFREGYNDMREKTRVIFHKNTSTSFLHFKTTSREDAGPYRCAVNNGIHGETKQNVWLLVKFKPEMDTNPKYMKAAANMGDTAELVCRCEAAPKPMWSWSRSGSAILANNSINNYKYQITTTALGPMTYVGTLLIKNVVSSDYGKYECTAKNSAGLTAQSVTLDVTSSPDQVISLSVINVTHDSVTLSWVPGFDGGLPSSFRIRYRTIYEDIYKYEDVALNKLSDGSTMANPNQWTVHGLQIGTDYVFSVMALNRLGQSKYRPDDVKATTLLLSVQSPSSGNDLGPYSFGAYPSMLIITCTIVGTALILLNILIVGFCLHRRAKKRIRGTIGNKNELTSDTSEIPEEILEKQDLPKNLIIGILGSSLIILVVLIVLVACAMYLRRRKRLRDQAGQSSKSATIEMYAPSSYNDTMTGETLSSVSEKSETYSNEDEGGSDHGHDIPGPHSNRIGQAASTYLTDAEGLGLAPPPLEYAPPRYQDTHNTLPHPRHHMNTLTRNSMKGYTNSPSPMPPMDGSYYNMSSERYFAYPPVLQQTHPSMVGRVPTPPQQYGLPIPNQMIPANMLIPGELPNNGMMPGKMGIGSSNPNVMMSSPTHGAGGTPPLNYMSPPMDGPLMAPNYIDRPMGGTLGRQRGQNKMAIHTQNGGNPHTVPPDVTVLHGNCTQNHPRSPPPCPAPPQSILKDPSRHLHKQHSNTMSQHSSPINTTQILTVQNLAANESIQTNIPTYGTIKRENKTANKMATANNDSGMMVNNSNLHSVNNMNLRGEIDTNAV